MRHPAGRLLIKPQLLASKTMKIIVGKEIKKKERKKKTAR
jgi:hypothetical protein